MIIPFQNICKIITTSLLIFIANNSITLGSGLQNKLFNQYITSNNAYISLLNSNVQILSKKTFEECDATKSIKRLKPRILETAQFIIKQSGKEETINGEHPHKGQWIERFSVNACSENLTLNHLAIANLHQEPTILPVINGNSLTEIIFHTKILNTLKQNLRDHETKCHSDIFVRNTGVLGYRNPETNSLSRENKSAGWFERWIVDACRRTYNINLGILPDPKTTYRFISRIEE